MLRISLMILLRPVLIMRIAIVMIAMIVRVVVGTVANHRTESVMGIVRVMVIVMII